ncbi:hypothetical protein EIK77_002243 [Talaromyces pinophilus]|nr:hypothetical protein EIK77_002243 [Talaromyces pinophilus]
MIRRASNKLQDITGPAQYDLPSTDKTTEEVKQAATLNESDKESAQNGQLTEDQRWARDRTGWAPQFVQPDEKREEAETLLDHRTFLEEKLGDKFFGGKLLGFGFPSGPPERYLGGSDLASAYQVSSWG